jgi:hypothetical protein
MIARMFGLGAMPRIVMAAIAAVKRTHVPNAQGTLQGSI